MDKRTSSSSETTRNTHPTTCGCGGGCCGSGLDRRAFLKTASLGLLATTLGQDAFSAALAETPGLGVSHFVPAEKDLPRGWIRSLFEKGAKEVFRGNELTHIAMPVGGIGTGQLYLCGDGTLACWELFNRHEFRGTGNRSYAGRIPPKPLDHGIAVVIERDGRHEVRELNREGFAEIEFTGEYPIARVRYADPDCPVEIEMEAFSPFIPLNAKDSALPATVFNLNVKNVSGKRVAVGCLSWLENASCPYTSNEVLGQRRNRLVKEKDRAFLEYYAEEIPPSSRPPERPAILLQDFEGKDFGNWKVEGQAFGAGPAEGPVSGQPAVSGFEGKGFANSFHGGDKPHGKLTSPPFTISRKYISFLIGGGHRENEECVNLVVDGTTVRSATGKNNDHLTWYTWKVADLEGKEARIEVFDKESEGWSHISVDQIEMADFRRGAPAGPIEKLDDFGTLALALIGGTEDPACTAKVFASLNSPRNKTFSTDDSPYPFPERRNSALLSTPVALAPNANHTFTLALAWHSPNAEKGHEYATRFPDAGAVVRYVLDNLDRLTAETRRWRDTYYDSTLPCWLLDRLHSTVSTLSTGTCQWWGNGRFYAYEGVVCCEGTCTHVWNYSHAEARLFPELARSTREMQDFCPVTEGGGFHPDTGLVGFRSNDAYAADGQCGTILKAYREHLMSADDAFLKRNWQKIRKALEFSMGQDENDDGLIENSQHNTYDINFVGPNTFVGSLYLAALRAGEEMAREMGDTAFADRAHRVFENGQRLTLERLWDGEYFIQDVDVQKYPKHQYGRGCLADQLFGQGWAHQVALGHVYPEDKVKSALKSIWKYNWAPDITAQNEAHKPQRWFVDPGEAGLFTCTWPKTPYLAEGVLYREEVWTGIEYQVAGNMIWDGMVTEGLAICRAVHDRYHPLKRNPYNEVECGDHYARAMASWGVYNALAGFEYHGPHGHIGFAPRITPEDFRVAFTAAEGWGTFAQERKEHWQKNTLTIRYGQLRLKTIRLDVGPTCGGNVTIKVRSGSESLPAHCAFEESRALITFAEDFTLKEDDTLTITFRGEKKQ